MPKVTQAHLDARRAQILDAAAACFARQGIRETKVQDICEEASLSPGAVYRYFKSKQEILYAVIDRHVVENREFPEMFDQFDDPVEGIAALVEMMFDYLAAPEMAEAHRLTMMIHGESVRDPAVARTYAGMLQDVVDSFAERIEGLKTAGLLAPDFDGPAFCWTLAGLYEGLRILKVIDADISTERIASCTREMVRAALRNE